MKESIVKEYKLLCDRFGDIIKCDNELLLDPLISFNIFLLHELTLRLFSILSESPITSQDIEEVEIKKNNKVINILIKRITKNDDVFYDVTLRFKESKHEK